MLMMDSMWLTVSTTMNVSCLLVLYIVTVSLSCLPNQSLIFLVTIVTWRTRKLTVQPSRIFYNYARDLSTLVCVFIGYRQHHVIARRGGQGYIVRLFDFEACTLSQWSICIVLRNLREWCKYARQCLAVSLHSRDVTWNPSPLRIHSVQGMGQGMHGLSDYILVKVNMTNEGKIHIKCLYIVSVEVCFWPTL